MILKFKEWINGSKINEDKGTHEYSCAMVYYDLPEMESLHSQIDEEDVYKDENDRSYGLENEPHATLLYGLHDNEVDPEDVKEICTNHEYPELKLHNISAFKNAKYDVLKFDIESDKLHQVNKELSKLPYSSDYPDYHPHSTIGYLKTGKADKYIEKFKGKEFIVNPSHIVYSRPNGEKLNFSIKAQ